jgi:peptidyl-prolyl cis-trans isomerase SurA
MNKKNLLLIVFACHISLFIQGQGQNNVIDEIIWVVGDEAILRSDVEAYRLQMLNERMRFEGDPFCFIPEQIAVDKLFLNQAKIDSISVDEGHVIRTVDSRIEMFINEFGSRERLEEYFNKRISQIREEQKVMMRERMTVQSMQEHLVRDIRLTPAEVRRYFQNISPDSLPMIPTTVEVQIVMFEPRIPVEETDAIKARLREFIDQVHNGEREFSFLARAFSEDLESSGRGGDLGWRSKGELVPEFANVAFNLSDPNRVSSVVETEYGFHIIRLNEKRGDRIHVSHILLRPRASENAIIEATARMDSLFTDILADKFSFEDAATYLSIDTDTKNNKGLMVNQRYEGNNAGTPKFEMQELPPAIGRVVDTLQVGNISAPFLMTMDRQQKEVIAIVKLRARTLSHRANLTDDYQTLKAIAEGRKREELLGNWIANKQRTTYVRIAEGWRNCDFQYPGWVR